MGFASKCQGRAAQSGGRRAAARAPRPRPPADCDLPLPQVPFQLAGLEVDASLLGDPYGQPMVLQIGDRQVMGRRGRPWPCSERRQPWKTAIGRSSSAARSSAAAPAAAHPAPGTPPQPSSSSSRGTACGAEPDPSAARCFPPAARCMSKTGPRRRPFT